MPIQCIDKKSIYQKSMIVKKGTKPSRKNGSVLLVRANSLEVACAYIHFKNPSSYTCGFSLSARQA